MSSSEDEVSTGNHTVGGNTSITINQAREYRAKRQSYRTLINEIKDQEKDSSAIADDFQTRSTQLSKMEELFEGVTRVNEMVYDSAAIELFSKREYLNIEKLQTNLTHFDVLEFCQKMLKFMDANRIIDETDEDDTEQRGVDIPFESWLDLGYECCFYKKSPAFHFMYGSFDFEKVEIKKRVVRRREVRDTKNPHTKPIEVKKLKSKDSTTEEVENVFVILNQVYEKNDRNPISYFKFCINPDSFSKTVENMFYVSFLIKDSLASIFLDENKLPVIVPIDAAAAASNKKKETKQIVTSIDMSEFQVLIECLDIKDAIIKRRQN